MKKSISIVWILCTLMLLCGCQKATYKIQLHQPENQIAGIAMIDNTGINKGYDATELLVIEDDEKIEDFLIDLQQVNAYKFCNDPSTSYGYLYIEVIYDDGAVDVIGTDMLEYRSKDGTTEDVYDGWYYADMDSMLELYKQYTGNVPVLP